MVYLEVHKACHCRGKHPQRVVPQVQDSERRGHHPHSPRNNLPQGTALAQDTSTTSLHHAARPIATGPFILVLPISNTEKVASEGRGYTRSALLQAQIKARKAEPREFLQGLDSESHKPSLSSWAAVTSKRVLGAPSILEKVNNGSAVPAGPGL